VTARPVSPAFTRRRVDGWALGAGLAIVAISAVPASSGRVGAAERTLFEAVNGLSDAFEPAMKAAQFLGVLAIGPAVALTALAFRRYRLALASAMITVGKLAAERIVWRLIERERPGVTQPEAIVRGGSPTAGVSFVSGHVVLVTGLAWAATPYLHGRWRIVPWLVVAIVGWARIYLGAHNPLDVLGGFGLGLALGGAANLVVGAPSEHEEQPERGAPAAPSSAEGGGVP
jgi:membrane-associated phospholipid phosphatase